MAGSKRVPGRQSRQAKPAEGRAAKEDPILEELERSLPQTWQGRKGEYYEVAPSFEEGSWTCIRVIHTRTGKSSRRFTLHYDDSAGKVWWGQAKKYYFYPRNFGTRPIEWYQEKKSSGRPAWVWRPSSSQSEEWQDWDDEQEDAPEEEGSDEAHDAPEKPNPGVALLALLKSNVPPPPAGGAKEEYPQPPGALGELLRGAFEPKIAGVYEPVVAADPVIPADTKISTTSTSADSSDDVDAPPGLPPLFRNTLQQPGRPAPIGTVLRQPLGPPPPPPGPPPGFPPTVAKTLQQPPGPPPIPLPLKLMGHATMPSAGALLGQVARTQPHDAGLPAEARADMLRHIPADWGSGIGSGSFSL